MGVSANQGKGVQGFGEDGTRIIQDRNIQVS